MQTQQQKQIELDTKRAELVAGMNMANKNQVILTFKRGDRCTIPHVANNVAMLGDRDYCHVRANRNQLNGLR